ncbi:hypothetical protein KG089_03215 [Carnobacteriaceae bacterium zg-ZUI252]|nr:hypothetical protein [Carnobacteriaceae bacterium zg-ZUI252]MBS4770045.1 hypothetical protein [Carnobacteriaceae bacterium zg-ZUI240]QTU83267.1 hypothetical protein J7S27_01750 [Carnobacteriaceae bacterium zg-C25]
MLSEKISLKELGGILKKYFWATLVAMVVGAVISLAIMLFLVKPKYQSEAQLLVNQYQNEKSVNIGDMQSNVYVINTYKDIITGQQLLGEVSQSIGGAYSVSQIRDAVSVTQSEGSQVFSVKVALGNANDAQKVLSEIIRLFQQKILQIFQMNESSVYVVQPATFNEKPISPRQIIFLAYGLIGGLVIVVLYAFIKEETENTVKNDDFLQALGVTKLGSVPRISEKDIQMMTQRNRRRKV